MSGVLSDGIFYSPMRHNDDVGCRIVPGLVYLPNHGTTVYHGDYLSVCYRDTIGAVGITQQSNFKVSVPDV